MRPIEEITLPNVRKMFLPDPGMTIYDADLSGADAQVVAWEAHDEDLMAAFRAGLKVHHKNAEDMWGSAYTSLTGAAKEKRYAEIKKGVHLTNYGGSARTAAKSLGWTNHEAEQFQRRWFSIHPAIKQWHRRVESQLQQNRSLTNAFGYRVYYFDRIDTLLTQALAWGPQSSVAISCFRGAAQVRRELPWVQLLLQVHDSLVFQIPHSKEGEEAKIRFTLANPIPYPEPLVIAWGLKKSRVSWGDCA